jgi:diacylglycerol kinase (ATP)
MISERVLFIINKFAGGGFLPKVEGKILDIGANYNVECTIEFTRSRGHATELARDGVEKGFNKIVAVGGDGTVNEVASGLVNTGIAMGIIPKGSGNGLGRHLGIPLHFEKAVESVFTGKPIAMDTFSFNGKLSVNVSGVGFDGHIANMFGKNGKRGLVGYAKLSLKEFLRFPEFSTEIRVDEKLHHTNAFIIAVANSSQYGNNARIAPIASVTDQKIHVTVLKKVPAIHSLAFLVRFFAGRVQSSSFCEIYEGQHIEIKTRTACAFHVDGEPSGTDHHFVASLQPRSLLMLVPGSSVIV